jgi:hypothetical protein
VCRKTATAIVYQDIEQPPRPESAKNRDTCGVRAIHPPPERGEFPRIWLNRDIDRVAGSAANKSEVFRKALQLYLAACDGQSRGLRLGLFEPGAQRLQTEITGL